MSAPIQDDKHIDPVLKYAPPHVRNSVPRPAAAERSSGAQAKTVSIETNNGHEVASIRRSLNLDRLPMPEPPGLRTDGRNMWSITLRAAAVIGVSATVAWIVVAMPQLGLLKGKATGSAPQLGVADLPAATRPESQSAVVAPVAQVEEPALQRDDKSSTPESAASSLSIKDSSVEDAHRTATEPVHPARPAAHELVNRQLDREELTSLIKRGDDFLRTGDLVSARLVLRRAAEGGDARAALMLANTFDPGALKRLGFARSWGDVAAARLWYEQATKLGSAEASERLQQLLAEVSSDQ